MSDTGSITTSLFPRGGRYEACVLTSAYEQGARFSPIFGFRPKVKAAFAKAHRGPVLVTDEWSRLASPRLAKRLLHDGAYDYSYTGRPVPAINGGLARSFDGFYFAGQTTPTREIDFFWTSGANIVNVNVTGYQLTVREARQIALLARPR